MRSLHQHRVQDWARRTLTTIGEACRAVKAETLERVVDWMVEKLTVEHWSVPEIKAVLAQSELCKSSVRTDTRFFNRQVKRLEKTENANDNSPVAYHAW
jgi:hypothetical protein